MTHTETRWALVTNFNGTLRLLGKFCWPNAPLDDPAIQTFPTRAAARVALGRCCYPKSRVVKVKVLVMSTVPARKDGVK